MRSALLALAACAMLLMVSPAGAQQRNPDTSVNPTASSVKEQQLLQELKRIQGRGTIPDTKSYVIEQPEGRDWRHFHEVTLRWIGAISIIGMRCTPLPREQRTCVASVGRGWGWGRFLCFLCLQTHPHPHP